MLYCLVLLSFGIYLLFNRSFKPQDFFVGLVGLFQGFPRQMTFKNLWLWLFMAHTFLLLGATAEIAFFQESLLFKGLLMIVDMPWAFALAVVVLDNPASGGETGLFLSFAIFGLIYWGGIGGAIYLIAKNVVKVADADSRVIFSFSMLKIKGGKPKSNRPPIICLKCEASNNPGFNICWQCGLPLDQQNCIDETDGLKKNTGDFKLLLLQLANYQNIFSKRSVDFGVLFIPCNLIAVLAGRLSSHILVLPRALDFVVNDVLITAFVVSAWFFAGPAFFLRKHKHESLKLGFGFKIVLHAVVPAIIISLIFVVVAMAVGIPIVMVSKKFDLGAIMKSIVEPAGLLCTVLLGSLAQGVAYRFLYRNTLD